MAERRAVPSTPRRPDSGVDFETFRLAREAHLRGGRGWLVRRALLLADLLGLVVAFLLAEVIFATGHQKIPGNATAEFAVFFASLPVWVVAAKLYGLYDRDEERADHSTVDDVTGVVQIVTLGAWAFFAFASLTHVAHPDVAKLTSFWLLAIAIVIFARTLARSFCRRSPRYLQNTIIVGGDPVGQIISSKLLRHPEYGLNLVGFVDRDADEQGPRPEGLPFLGQPSQLPELVVTLDVERVIFAFPEAADEESLELIRLLNDLNVQIDITPRLSEILGPSVAIHTIEGLPLVALPRFRLGRSSLLLKRAFDIAVTTAALIPLAPFLLVIALLVKTTSRGPIIFKQVRIGSQDKPFPMYKFRTMVVDAEARKSELAHLNKHAQTDARMFKIKGDPRVTTVGRWLRLYSLDELPQLINVLRGEMSIVGPRPLIPEEHRFVEKWARKRLDLKPGITGLWQVLGRSNIPFNEMVKLDYMYVTGWSLAGDLKLIARTIRTVLRKSED
jgi:exopolysaccharide biosynthesis polyprenyl glycosylphosphotransferase